MQYANINTVYRRIEEILNKNQLGFISPSQYNVLAPQAQHELYDEILERIQQYTKTKLGHYDDEGDSIINGLRDDISTLLVFNELQSASSGTNIFDYPSRYSYIESMTLKGAIVDIVTPKNVTYYSNSYYTPVTEDYAIAILGSNQIEIIPDTLSEGIKMSYYKNPLGSQNGSPSTDPPTWAYIEDGEDLLFDSTNSYDFELPKSVEEKLVYKVLQLAAFSTREIEAIQFAEKQEQKDKSTEL